MAAAWMACTKKLFQEKKLSPGESRGFAVFAGVLRGVLEKVWCRTWFFDGEVVVFCVVNVVF
jgi:hypothetical protein